MQRFRLTGENGKEIIVEVPEGKSVFQAMADATSKVKMRKYSYEKIDDPR